MRLLADIFACLYFVTITWLAVYGISNLISTFLYLRIKKSLDNEPELWNSTHWEIQGSTAEGADDYIQRTISLASALTSALVMPSSSRGLMTPISLRALRPGRCPFGSSALALRMKSLILRTASRARCAAWDRAAAGEEPSSPVP